MTTFPLDSTTSRIVFREPVSSAGFIDAAWWPRSLDLARELPPLLEVLWDSGREITRLSYAIGSWDTAPRRIRFRGNTIHLGGFLSGNQVTVLLTDAWRRERIDVLVLAPTTPADVAQRALALAARAGGSLRAEEILTAAGNADTGTAATPVPA